MERSLWGCYYYRERRVIVIRYIDITALDPRAMEGLLGVSLPKIYRLDGVDVMHKAWHED